jgi:hypothetical protein
MTLFELLAALACITAGLFFSAYMGSSHHWVLGVMAFPLGFFAAATVSCLLGEVAIRRGYSRLCRTPGVLIRRSMIIGVITGLPAGALFYVLAVRGDIPTALGGWHRAGVSACAFGASVALTVAFFLMSRNHKPSITTNAASCGR